MENKRINHLSVFVAAIPYILLGYPWFSIFRDPWFEGGGLTVEQLINGPGYLTAFSIAIISSILMSYVLRFFITLTGKLTVSRGLKIAFSFGQDSFFRYWQLNIPLKQDHLHILQLPVAIP